MVYWPCGLLHYTIKKVNVHFEERDFHYMAYIGRTGFSGTIGLLKISYIKPACYFIAK